MLDNGLALALCNLLTAVNYDVTKKLDDDDKQVSVFLLVVFLMRGRTAEKCINSSFQNQYSFLTILMFFSFDVQSAVSAIVKTKLSVRGVTDSIPRLVKSDTVSPTARHRYDVSSELCCSGAKLRRWARHSIHAGA